MLVWYNYLPSLHETLGKWRVPYLITWGGGGGGGIPAGNCIIRDSRVFTYIYSTFPNMWAVFVSTIFCVLCSDDLPEIWMIKFWVPFFIMPSASIATGIVLVLSFHIFIISISRSLYLESFRNSVKRNIFICWNCNNYHDTCILFKFFIVISGRFAFIFLSVLIMKLHRIVTSVLCVTVCGVCWYHFLCRAG